MNISSTEYKNCDLIKFSGNIDHNTADSFAEALEVITKARRYNIVLDMSDVVFMSSAGLRVLVTVQTTCKEHNGDLVLALVQERVYEALEVVAFVKFFKIYDSVLDAVNSF